MEGALGVRTRHNEKVLELYPGDRSQDWSDGRQAKAQVRRKKTRQSLTHTYQMVNPLSSQSASLFSRLTQRLYLILEAHIGLMS